MLVGISGFITKKRLSNRQEELTKQLDEVIEENNKLIDKIHRKYNELLNKGSDRKGTNTKTDS